MINQTMVALCTALLTGIGLTACSSNAEATRYKTYSVGAALLYDVTLDDGTRCIAHTRGGVDCDFPKKQEEVH